MVPRVSRLKLIWTAVNIYVFWSTYRYYATRQEFYYLREMLGVGLMLSRASASVLTINCSLIFLPVCRFVNSTIHLTFSVINRSVLKCWLYNVKRIHMMLASFIMVASVLHTLGHVTNAINASAYYNKQYPSINWAYYPNENAFLIILRSISGASGLFMLVFLFIMGIFSLPWFRKNDYVLFSTAHCLFLPFVVLFFIHPLSQVLTQQTNHADHVPGCEFHKNCTADPTFVAIPLQSWKWMLPVFSVYLFDMAYRTVMRNKLNFHVKNIQKYPGNVYKLTLTGNRIIKMHPAQYVLLQCSEISFIEWHPFTVVSYTSDSCRKQSDITVFIQACGDWTKTLANYLRSNLNEFHCKFGICRNSFSNKAIRLKFLIDGGFFSPLSDILKNDIVFCIAFGIGITPFASILTYLNRFGNITDYPPRFHLVWVVPYSEYLLWFEDLFCDIHNKSWKLNRLDLFEYRFYVTREENQSKNTATNSFLQNRISFGKPDWSNLLETWHSLYYRSSYQLFICGPKSAMTCVQKACDRLSKESVTFQCVHETFT